MRKRFVITMSRGSDGTAVRISVDPAVVIAAVLLLIGSPVLFVVGTSWGARQVIGDLLRQNAALRVENASYREATSQLVEQVASLHAAADDLGARARVDPAAARAMERLPSSVTSRAMGGGGTVAEVTAPLTNMLSSTEPAFGLLRDVVYLIERKLDEVRPGVEQREALAAATPSIWPVPGWLSSAYGSRRDPFTGGSDFHRGLDISADHGQPVRATADGLVTAARRNGNYGNMVVLDHGFSIGTRYGHLSRFAVTEGQRVRRGDVIGYVGSSGRSTSPHVHYELMLNGRTVNPMKLLGR
jgi:murein DD-endopeptidase MepM/ murein hydrolase activator NlpD